MTEDPLNVGIVWDADNHLTEVKQGATTLASFVYDGMGRRQQKTAGGVTHSHVWDAGRVLEVRAGTGEVRRYVEGVGIDQHLAIQDGAAVTYYLADHLGSVAQETNASGAVALTRTYDPWGNLLTGANSSGWAFTSREWDSETGLTYYRARYYDPKAGRFTSEDPIGLDGGDVNFYGYVGNAPVRFTDPMGLQADSMSAGLKKCLEDAGKGKMSDSACYCFCGLDPHGEGYATCVQHCVSCKLAAGKSTYDWCMCGCRSLPGWSESGCERNCACTKKQ